MVAMPHWLIAARCRRTRAPYLLVTDCADSVCRIGRRAELAGSVCRICAGRPPVTVPAPLVRLCSAALGAERARPRLLRGRSASRRPDRPPAGPTDQHPVLRSDRAIEFLDLKDEYSESDLENALIHHLETFLMELAGTSASSPGKGASASATNGIASISSSFTATFGVWWLST